jgi:tetratricopeptide (TPR) repeat protein
MITDTKPLAGSWADTSVERPSKRALRAKRWVFNWRLLIITAGLLAALMPAAYFWHAYQVDRNASALLDLADRSEGREEWMRAAEDLHRYLQLRPSDVKNIVRMAEDFYKGAKLPLQKLRAVQLYGRAIALAPERDDLQRRQMALRLEVGDHRSALEQARNLLAKTPDDAEALRVRALALHEQWRLRRSVETESLLDAFRAAIERNPRDTDLASGLAYFYRSELPPTKERGRAELDKLADHVLDHLVATSDQAAAAYAARYVYRRQFNLPEADADLDLAIAADEKKATFVVWWLAGARSQRAADYATAVDHFKRAIAIDAGDRRGHLGLGNAYSSQGKQNEAIEAWREGLAKASPDDLEFELLIAEAEVRDERWKQAKADLDRVEKQLAPMTGPQASSILGSLWLLRGEIAIGEKKFGAALPSLKQALTLRQAGARSDTRAALIAQVQTRLGQCYAALGEWDQAALAFQQTSDLLPREPGRRLQAAAAYEYAGRYDEAVRQYDAALALKDVAPGAWVAAANAESLRQASMPRAQRDWQAVANRVAKAKEELAKENLPEPLLLTIVESEHDAEQGLVEKALERCQTVEAAALVNKSLVRRLIFDYERWERSDDADRLLEQLRSTDDGQLDHLLLSSELLFRRNHREEAYRLLTNALAGANDDSRRALQYRLAVMYLTDGKADQARPILERVAEADKNDMRPLQFLAELALQAGEVDKPISYNTELESREGADGTNWRYYRAQQLMQRGNAIGKTDPAAAAKLYQQAAELQEQIESLRPAWPPGYLLKARLAETRPLKAGNGAAIYDEPAAIQAYTQAIRLGARSVPVYEALINLLFRQSRINEADAYLDQLRDVGPLPDELSTVAMAIDVRQGKLDRAVALAREGIAAEPDDAMRHSRLGMLLAREAGTGESANRDTLAEAERELRRSRELAPADTRTWAALLSFYKGNEQIDAARALLAEAEKTNALGDEETPFFLAQGYAAVGDDERAAAHYYRAIEAAPNRAAVQFQSGAYFLKRDSARAKGCLQRTLELEPNHRGAAELLAVLLASEGGSEAEIDRLLSEGRIEPKDQRLHAMLLLRRGGTEHRRQAQQILEALAGNDREAAPIDRLLLARMYEAQAALAAARGESKPAEASLAAAREQLKALVNSEHPAPEHLAAYIDNLLRCGRGADVAGRLDELARLEPETSSIRTLSLRLRYLKEQQDERQFRPLIDSYVDNRLKALSDKTGQARVLQAAAELYSSYDLPEEAERAFRRACELDVSAAAALVNWLVNRERTSDAVQFCVQLGQNDATPLSAILLSNALAIGKPNADDLHAAAPVIESALKEHGEDPNLLFAVSVNRLMDGNNDESIRLLRQVLKLQPRHAPAMNNLAFLLSLKPDAREEAAQWIAKVISLAGGNAELVDSKGWVLMQQHKLTEAVEAFGEALTRSPADPRYHFHLALAYQLQGKLKEARDAFEIARRSGIESAMMPPDERSALTRLETALQ